MGLKEMLGQLDMLTVFCLVMAVVSYFFAWAMALLWVVTGVLWQVGKAQQIKASIKGLFASFKGAPSVGAGLPSGVAAA